MRKTKIICTIGPASENRETLVQMCHAGMNVARLNFSHGTHEEHQAKIDLIKSVREELDIPLAIMLDTKGPEYRIGTFVNGKAEVNTGDKFTFVCDDIVGDNTRCTVNYKELAKCLSVGDRVLVNNGLVIFEVSEIQGADVICDVVCGGILSNRKSMCFPNKVMNGPYLSEQDKADILFGIQNDIDFIAASFVSNEKDMIELTKFLKANGGSDIGVIAKIENRAGIENVEAICKHCCGIMVARGDLGVEIPFIELPAVQKQLIATCRHLGKRVIVATEMLESMIQNPRPTRAEISDVANAVYDSASAIMLSGESAAGKYPVEAVKNMAEIAEFTENSINYNKRFNAYDFSIRSTQDALSHATCSMAIDVHAKAIVACTTSGSTAMMVSRFRGPVDIVGMTTNKKAWRQLALSWGVIPVLSDEFNSMDVMFYHAMICAKKALPLQEGDKVVMTGGPMNGQSGNTNTIKVEIV